MNLPLRQSDHDELNAYCDGRLSGAERTHFEARLEREPLLRAEFERQRSIDASLRRLFVAPAAPVLERLRASGQSFKLTRSRLPWRALATAAALALIVGGGWWQWRRMIQPPPGPPPKQTIFANYQSEVSSGFHVAGKCWGDKEFAFVFYDKLAIAMTVTAPAAGVDLLGIDYSNTLSQQTVMLMAKVNGAPVIAYVDRIERDTGAATQPAGCAPGVNLYRRAVEGVVIYEVSTLDRPHLLELVRRIEMTPEWLEEYKRVGPPY
jgi:hypothetical protein